MIGQTVSHYRIVEKLGQGGMGVVYRAEDLKLKRSVALKFLTGELASREARARFLREAQAAASLDHPHICTVHEIGEHEDNAFMVMALVEGGDLRGRIESGPLPMTEALDLAIEVAEGLELAHSRGIVHRDIKLANIMIGKDGGARIMDFGLAKLVDATAMTRSATDWLSTLWP